MVGHFVRCVTRLMWAFGKAAASPPQRWSSEVVTLFVIQPALVLWMDGLHHSDINLGWSAAALCNSSRAQRYQVLLCGWKDVVYLRKFVLCLLSLCLCSADFPYLPYHVVRQRDLTHQDRELFHIHSWRVFLQQEVCGCAAIDRAAWFSMSVAI